jgi:hypothetical protein
MFLNNVGKRNTHTIEEVLQTCVDCQSKLVFLIGGGANLFFAWWCWSNLRKCMPLSQHAPPFRTFETCAQKPFSLGGINGMCQHRTSKKKQLHMLICMMSLVGCIRH